MGAAMPSQDTMYAITAGAAGALAWFLVRVQRGAIRNDHYVRKGMVESAGGMLVASFVAVPISPIFSASAPIILVAFACGAAWAQIIEVLRNKLTDWLRQNHL